MFFRIRNLIFGGICAETVGNLKIKNGRKTICFVNLKRPEGLVHGMLKQYCGSK